MQSRINRKCKPLHRKEIQTSSKEFNSVRKLRWCGLGLEARDLLYHIFTAAKHGPVSDYGVSDLCALLMENITVAEQG